MTEFQDEYHEGIWKAFREGSGLQLNPISVRTANGYLVVYFRLTAVILGYIRCTIKPDGAITATIISIVSADYDKLDWYNGVDPRECGQYLSRTMIPDLTRLIPQPIDQTS